ncbi:MAG: NUDIX domain-containing protein [Planctomycetes bacterium]|nr:NUDIX domain-containing protein [Planctomycetota bacterium]
MSKEKPQSSGTLLFRWQADKLEVLLVHPSGNYNKQKPWSIPKGQPDPGETLEAAARRETLEETGVVAGDLIPLGSIRYLKSGKQIHCFVGSAPETAEPICASWEVDRAEFVSLKKARKCLHPDQVAFLDRLLALPLVAAVNSMLTDSNDSGE